MILKCPNCDGALEYDINTGKMSCKFCNSQFSVAELNQQIKEDDMMISDIYRCTTCGAELMINGVEAATFCAYCGQPTIVLDRITKHKKPKYIIPFSIQKEEALGIIRKRLKKGLFVPKYIKNFKVDELRGIYVPFSLTDIHYEDKQLIKGRIKSGKNKVTKYFVREGQCDFKEITVDASKHFQNESSVRLEPFRLQEKQPFQAGYLSGYYADCSDENRTDLEELSRQRAKELFDKHMIDSVSASEKEIKVNQAKHEISSIESALLPVWFLVFHDDTQYYTIMVNGQTGKIVGAVPYSKRKASITYLGLATLLSFIGVKIIQPLLISSTDANDLVKGVFSIIVVLGFIFIFGFGVSSDLKKSQQLTTQEQMKNLVANRQDN